MPFVYRAIAILAEVVGTTALKASNGFTVWVPSAVVVVAYGEKWRPIIEPTRVFCLRLSTTLTSSSGASGLRARVVVYSRSEQNALRRCPIDGGGHSTL